MMNSKRTSYLTLLLVFVIGFWYTTFAQQANIKSDVYRWRDVTSPNGNEIVKGSTTDLEFLEVKAIRLLPGKSLYSEKSFDNEEVLAIVKEGNLNVTVAQDTKQVGPGSVALILPGDKHGFKNGGDVPVTFYLLNYRSKKPINIARGKEAGGSFMINWNDLTFKPHDKGGIRNYFEKPTAMMERFEMHVTTLDEGLKSHNPHTHRAAEIVLMIKGDAEMQIGDDFKKASAGSLIFLASEVPHALRNAGKGPCEYFAFQWQ